MFLFNNFLNEKFRNSILSAKKAAITANTKDGALVVFGELIIYIWNEGSVNTIIVENIAWTLFL